MRPVLPIASVLFQFDHVRLVPGRQGVDRAENNWFTNVQVLREVHRKLLVERALETVRGLSMAP